MALVQERTLQTVDSDGGAAPLGTGLVPGIQKGDLHAVPQYIDRINRTAPGMVSNALRCLVRAFWYKGIYILDRSD
jgi:hypothetical protein